MDGRNTRNNNGRIVIIDGNSLINRAYYAMQRPMMTKEGLYTQGVYGFLNMLAKIRKDYEPEYLAVTFDRKAPTFRHLEYEDYKAGRKKMPPELAMQMPLLKEVLAAMNIKMLEIDGYEADDIIGTIAVKAEKEGLAPLIITGDKDELQLATDVTKILITKKGISEFDIYDRNAMIEKYGFTPQQFIDFKGLMGDQSDNIPGLPGVGEKTATKLLLEYGSVENIIASLDDMPASKLKDKIAENAHLAVMSKKLATIFTEVPLPIDFEEFREVEPDYDALIDVYTKLEFNSFLKNLKKPEKEKNETESITEDSISQNIEIIKVKSDDVLSNVLSDIKESKNIVIKTLSDNNHRSLPQVYGMMIMTTKKAYYFDGAEGGLILSVLKFIANEKIQITGHELQKDYFALLSLYGKDIAADESYFNTSFDTEIASYLLDSSRSSYSITLLAFEYLHEEIEEDSKFIASNAQLDMFTDRSDIYSAYCFKWCCIVKRLASIIKDKIREEELERVLYEVELPLIEVLASMEKEGFGVDREALVSAGKEISERIKSLSEEIYRLSGEEFNINSPAQLGVVLFEKLGLPAGKKTKTGYSTNAEVLEKLRDQHPVINLILEYRMLSKLNGTYIDGLIPLIADDNKIHAHFKQTVTATGRISCTEPNLQNIPVRQEEGRNLRKAFVPGSDGWSLVGADYSQIELRVLADMSNDEKLIESFNNGEDIHRTTAAKVFDIPAEEVTSAERSAAKAVNFGVIYGMSSFGLSTEINVTRKEAETYINEYFKRFPAVKEFMDRQIALCRMYGYVETMMGRKRYIKEINASQYMVRQLGERLAMNTPIQGSAADIIKLAMIKVYRKLREEKLEARLILQVHDELIIETPENEKEHVSELLKECMENIMDLEVKFTVGLNTGYNWYELK
ncbi:MAG: DNA polymerase I [Firmicutes bacterium]|nr:DNA polymerase I [Bacillota bacterium]